jgi:hypothetical protein
MPKLFVIYRESAERPVEAATAVARHLRVDGIDLGGREGFGAMDNVVLVQPVDVGFRQSQHL